MIFMHKIQKFMLADNEKVIVLSTYLKWYTGHPLLVRTLTIHCMHARLQLDKL